MYFYRYSYYDPGEIFLFFITIPLVLVLAFGVLPFWCICKKAGYPPWYSLAVLVPPFNIAFLFFMAFSEWPVLRQLDILAGRRLEAPAAPAAVCKQIRNSSPIIDSSSPMAQSEPT
jgi:hypothetical protein